jgi:hypothetical protein
MERSMDRIGGYLIATVMIGVGALIGRVAPLHGLVLALMGTLLVCDLAGVFPPRIARVRHGVRPTRGARNGQLTERRRRW